jgi:hypothetical protein
MLQQMSTQYLVLRTPDGDWVSHVVLSIDINGEVKYQDKHRNWQPLNVEVGLRQFPKMISGEETS